MNEQRLSADYRKKYPSIWREAGILFRLVGLMGGILLLSWNISMQGREPYMDDFLIQSLITLQKHFSPHWTRLQRLNAVYPAATSGTTV